MGEEVLANPRADGEALPEARPKVYLGSRPLDAPGLPRFGTNLSAAALPALSEGVFGMDKFQKTDQA